MDTELYRHGVKGMKWGVRHLPVVADRSYHKWRMNRNLKVASKYEKKANETKNKTWLNPYYVLASGLSKGHGEAAKKHEYAIDFINMYLENNGSMIRMLDKARIDNGKAYIGNLELK